jgi:hypothetical protein
MPESNVKSPDLRHSLGFEVWTHNHKLFNSEADHSKPVATFYYWLDALDFRDACLARGFNDITVRTQNPNGQWSTLVGNDPRKG